MQKQKIKLSEWTEIGKYNFAQKWIRPFCTYTLEMDEGENILRTQKISSWLYALIFIPCHIFLLFGYAWEEGLKHYEICPSFLGYDVLSWGSVPWERAKKILIERYNKTDWFTELEGEENHG